jgi:hypothetical protein
VKERVHKVSEFSGILKFECQWSSFRACASAFEPQMALLLSRMIVRRNEVVRVWTGEAINVTECVRFRLWVAKCCS